MLWQVIEMQGENKSNRNGIYIIPSADEFIQVMKQLQKEYNQNNKGAINNE